MIREKVEERRAVVLVFELISTGKVALMLIFVGDEIGRTLRAIRRAVATSLRRIESQRFRRMRQFLLQGIGKKNALCEFSD